MNSVTLRPWAILALIFLLGAATGALLTIGLGPRLAHAPPGPKEMGNHWMMHLTRRLNLTDDQQARIRPIIMDAEKEIEAVHRNDVRQILTFLGNANTKIAAVLDPGQQAELKKMEQEREQTFMRRMHGRGRPGPRGFRGHGPDEFPPEPPPTLPADETNAPPPS